MNVLSALPAIVLATIVALSSAGRATPPPASMRLMRSVILVEPDGTATQTIDLEVDVNNDAAVRQNAQQTLPFTDGVDSLTFVAGATRKPDGTNIPVAPSAVHTQLAQGVANYPEFSDRKQLTAIFPSVAPGDTLVMSWRRTFRPFFPGRFAWTSFFVRSLEWREVDLMVSVPDSLPLVTEAIGPASDTTQAEGRTIHHWTWSAPAVADDAAALSPLDRAPRLFVSSFPDWTSFARTYAGLIQDKIAVTPPIQALADRIAAPAPDKREQARLLYEWVSRNVRWVAVYLGTGSFIPHTADSVLTHGYGDCKDQVMLLIALLQARGIKAEPVLINLGNTFRLSGPPTYTAFNHAITFLPDLGIYADTTVAAAPFGTLPSQEYGKPVLHAAADGEAVRTIPPLPPGLATVQFRTTATLDADGHVAGRSVTHATGPYATALRGIEQRQLEPQGTTRAADKLMESHGDRGTGTFAFPAPSMGADEELIGRFDLDPQPGWLDGDTFQVPSGLYVLPRPGEGILGPAQRVPLAEPVPCYAAAQEEQLSLTLPPGFRPGTLPRSRSIHDDAFDFRSDWSFETGVVHVIRRLDSRIDQVLCTGDLRKRAAAAQAIIRQDRQQNITLERIE